jgi:polar amino acid transport system substrate-binding protein
MKKTYVFLSIVLLLFVCNTIFAENQPAKDLVASLAKIPGLADSPEKGAFVDIVKAIDEIYPGNIKIEVVPFERSIKSVLEGKADFHIPIIRNPVVSSANLPYRYVTEKIGTVPIVIYSNKAKIVTRKNIEDAVAKGGKFPYIIEVAGGLEPIYPFPSVPSNNSEGSLRKVQSQRADAFLFGNEVDEIVKSLKLGAIHRELYGNFDDAMVIAKGPKGDELDKILSDCLKKLRTSGRLQTLVNKVHQPYNGWQPADMGW